MLGAAEENPAPIWPQPPATTLHLYMVNSVAHPTLTSKIFTQSLSSLFTLLSHKSQFCSSMRASTINLFKLLPPSLHSGLCSKEVAFLSLLTVTHYTSLQNHVPLMPPHPHSRVLRHSAPPFQPLPTLFFFFVFTSLHVNGGGWRMGVVRKKERRRKPFL